jgi:hypothetical protein
MKRERLAQDTTFRHSLASTFLLPLSCGLRRGRATKTDDQVTLKVAKENLIRKFRKWETAGGTAGVQTA